MTVGDLRDRLGRRPSRHRLDRRARASWWPSGGSANRRGIRRADRTMLADAGDNTEDPIPVAIETPRGLLVAVLRATGRPVYPINPMAVARYRERLDVGQEADHADAMALANILRTDAARTIAGCPRTPNWPNRSRCWPAPTRTPPGGAPRPCRSCGARLREYYPGFLRRLRRSAWRHQARQRRRPSGAGHRARPRPRRREADQAADRRRVAPWRPPARHRPR